MSINVNPPPQMRMPSKFSTDKEVASWFTNNQRVLTQLFLRSGGSVDNGELMQSQIDQLFMLVGLGNDITETTTSTDYTTISNNLVRVEASCVITLNLSPVVGERSLIQPQGNFFVTVVGNINGESQFIMNNAYDLMDVRYTELGWVIV